MVVFMGLWRFHRGFYGLRSKIGLFMYVYGKSPGFLHIFECKIHDFNVYGISPTFLGSFQSNVSQFWCALSALVLFAGKIAYLFGVFPWSRRNDFHEFLAQMRLEREFPDDDARPGGGP
jgi:hypothetical protein